MPLTTIYDGGTRVIGSGTVISQGLHPTVMEYISIMSSNGGYSMTVNEIDAINNMVWALVSYGIWAKIKAIYPILGGTAATHKFNLKDPRDANAAFRLTFTGGWTHSANGMTPNGLDTTADTFFVPSVDNVVNSSHMSYYSRTLVSESRIEMGCYVGNNYNQIAISFGGITYCNPNNGSGAVDVGFNSNSQGFFLASRTGSNVMFGQRNTFQLAGSAITTRNTNSILIGNANGLGNTFVSTKQCAFASIGDGLTTTEGIAFYSIVQAYQQKLGRAV